MSPTAVLETDSNLVSLATGDIRMPIHEQRGALPTLAAQDQAYPNATGTRDLREAVAQLTSEFSTATVTSEQIVITPGARLAILLLLRACTEQRRQILLPTPYWSSYPELIRYAGAVPVPVPGTVASGLLDTEKLAAHLTPDIAAVVINSPRNPDGAVMPAEQLHELVTWAESRDLYVLFDQVYRGVTPLEHPAPSILDLFGELPGHCAVVDGLSKSHALAGLRIGWLIADGALRARAAAAASHLLGGVCELAQRSALAALRDTPVIRRRVVSAVAEHVDHAMTLLADLPGVDCPRPDSGFFLFPDLREWLTSSAPAEATSNVAQWLRCEHGVAVVNGAAFGAPGHIRLSVAVPRDQLDGGLQRLAGAVSAVSTPTGPTEIEGD